VKYATTLDGQSFELLIIAGPKAVLRVTGAPWTSNLRYDKLLADARPPQHLLTDYLDGPRNMKYEVPYGWDRKNRRDGRYTVRTAIALVSASSSERPGADGFQPHR
jgi:hypothetical protein